MPRLWLRPRDDGKNDTTGGTFNAYHPKTELGENRNMLPLTQSNGSDEEKNCRKL